MNKDPGTTINRQIDLFMLAWNTVLAGGLLSFLLKYKLNINNYFPQWEYFLRAQSLTDFISDKWGVIILSLLYIFLFVAATLEAKNSREIGESLFSATKKPILWDKVEGRSFFFI